MKLQIIAIFFVLAVQAQPFIDIPSWGHYTSPAASGSAIVTNGLVGWWRWNEGSGTTSADLSGNANTASLVNSPTWTTLGGDGALGYDGATTYVDCGTASTLNPATITVCAWIKMNSLVNSYSAIVSKSVSGGASNEILVKSNGKLAVYAVIAGGGTINYDGTGTYTLTVGTTNFIAFTYDSGSTGLSGYVNGSLDATTGPFGVGLLSNSGNTLIGNDAVTTGRIPNAVIGMVLIYNRALTASEILKNYNAGL